MYEIVIGRSPADKDKYGLKGTLFFGKHYVKMGRTTSLSNDVYLDVAGAHVVFICGKRGGGKCLSGDTLITLDDGSLCQIKDLEHNTNGVVSLNKSLKLQKSAKSHFYKRPVNTLLELKLRTGKTIKLTPEHPLLTINGWTPVKNLNIGSKIATPRKIEIFGDEKLSEDKIKLLAYLITEGHVSNNFVLFSNMDEKIINDFKSSVNNFDCNLEVKLHSKKGCFRVVENKKRELSINTVRDDKGKFKKTVFDSKSSIRKWLDNIGVYGKLAHEKELPKNIFSLEKKGISLLLNRMFSCDGSIYKEGKNYWKLSYSTSSKKLAEQVSHLLLRFGIIAFTREKKTKRLLNYELVIRGEFVEIFLKEIGFFGEKQKREEKAFIEIKELRRNPNLDTIPKQLWQNYKVNSWTEIGKNFDYKHPKSMRETMHYDISRQKLLQIAKVESSEILETIAMSDIYWDEIISLNLIEGEFEVYDLTVPEHHNFLANDIIVHNSYTMGVIAEGMAALPDAIKKNLSFVFLDTMGIYWTMKYPNKKDQIMLKDWGLEPKSLDIKIYTPKGYYKEFKDKGIPTDYPFSIKPSELDARDWCTTFSISPIDPIGVAIESTIYRLKEEKEDYTLDEIIEMIKSDDSSTKETKDAAVNRFVNAKNWGLFDEEGTPLSSLVKGGQVSILDVSCYATQPGGWDIKNLVIGIVSQKLFIQRMIARRDEEFKDIHSQMNFFYDEDKPKEMEDPLVWLVIDEAHEFLPREGKTLATDPLVTIMREGRQPGISLMLATQQPGKIHTDVMTQSDIIISHRITAKIDTDALSALTQSYMREGLDKYLNELPHTKGSAIILDDNNEKIFPIKIRPRFTWHGGGSPYAIKEEKKIFEF